MVESAGLEIRCTVLRTVGSNPTLSAKSSTYECMRLDYDLLEPRILDTVQYLQLDARSGVCDYVAEIGAETCVNPQTSCVWLL